MSHTPHDNSKEHGEHSHDHAAGHAQGHNHAFLEKLTLRPEEIAKDDAKAVLAGGVTPKALEEAIAVASIFNIVRRYADALDFAIPTAEEFDRAGDMLLKRGYV